MSYHSPEPGHSGTTPYDGYAEPGYGLRSRAFPFYIVCDVSHSMWVDRKDGHQTPFEILSTCIPELLFELETGDLVVSEAAHVSIIAFHDKVHEVLPLVRPCDAPDVPALPKGGQTDYRLVFGTLRQVIERDCAALAREYQLKTPMVFFITDGEPFVGDRRQPPEVWRPVRDQVAGLPYRPHITAMGFGRVTERTLCQVATEFKGRKLAYVADEARPATVVVAAICQAVTDSITASVTGPDFVVRVPEGMRQISCGTG